MYSINLLSLLLIISPTMYAIESPTMCAVEWISHHGTGPVQYAHFNTPGTAVIICSAECETVIDLDTGVQETVARDTTRRNDLRSLACGFMIKVEKQQGKEEITIRDSEGEVTNSISYPHAARTLVSANDRYMVVIDKDHRLSLYDFASNRIISKDPSTQSRLCDVRCAFDYQGEYIIVNRHFQSGSNRKVSVYSVKDGFSKEIKSFEVDNNILEIVTSPTASGDYMIRTGDAVFLRNLFTETQQKIGQKRSVNVFYTPDGTPYAQKKGGIRNLKTDAFLEDYNCNANEHDIKHQVSSWEFPGVHVKTLNDLASTYKSPVFCHAYNHETGRILQYYPNRYEFKVSLLANLTRVKEE
jgi:hypothetical protein